MPYSRYEHEFETTQGDELTPQDMRGVTWKVVETYIGIEDQGIFADVVVFTHRIEVHRVDDLMMEVIGGEDG
jgi:hypothetical protein